MELLADKNLRNLKISQLEEISAETVHLLAQRANPDNHPDYLQHRKLSKYLATVKSVLKHKINTNQA